MTDKGERQQQDDELDLEAETVKDLEVRDEDAEQVEGGAVKATCVLATLCA